MIRRWSNGWAAPVSSVVLHWYRYKSYILCPRSVCKRRIPAHWNVNVHSIIKIKLQMIRHLLLRQTRRVFRVELRSHIKCPKCIWSELSELSLRQDAICIGNGTFITEGDRFFGRRQLFLLYLKKWRNNNMQYWIYNAINIYKTASNNNNIIIEHSSDQFIWIYTKQICQHHHIIVFSSLQRSLCQFVCTVAD